MAIVEVTRRQVLELEIKEKFHIEVDSSNIELDEDEELTENIIREEAEYFLSNSYNNNEYQNFEISSQEIVRLCPKSHIVTESEIID